MSNASRAAARKALPQGRFLNATSPPHVMIVGEPGAGKTFCFVAMLLAGERVFVVNTEPGKDGLVTVRNELQRLGRQDLFPNLFEIPVQGYEQLESAFENAEEHYEFKPTVFVWEGLSVFQLTDLDSFIMPDELRPEADAHDKDAVFAHWDKVRRATTRIHDRYLRCFPDITHVTTADVEPRYDSKGNDTGDKKILIKGQAFRVVMKGYSVVLQVVRKQEGRGQNKRYIHYYRFNAPEGDLTLKNRGFPLDAEQDGNFSKVWAVLRGHTVASKPSNRVTEEITTEETTAILDSKTKDKK